MQQQPSHTSPAHCSPCLTICLSSVPQSSLRIPLLALCFCCRKNSHLIHTILSIMQCFLPPWLLYIVSLPKVFKTVACCPPLSSKGLGKQHAASDTHQPQKSPYLCQTAPCARPCSSRNASMSCRALIWPGTHHERTGIACKASS